MNDAEQKFHKDDLVRIDERLCNNGDAIVIGSYADQYGGNDRRSYTLHVKGRGQISWYNEESLTLIECSRGDLLEQWKKEAADLAAQQSDLDWLFANGAKVVAAFNATMAMALANCTADDLWGPSGEGFVLYERCNLVLTHARPYLLAGNKQGWLERRKELGPFGAKGKPE